MLRLGLFGHLQRKYRPEWGDAAKLLSVAIVNSAILEEPGNDDGIRFRQTNRALIEREALALHADEKSAMTLRHLYAAELMNQVLVSGSPFSERSDRLTERATDLGIEIPNLNELCGSRNVHRGIEALAAVAERLFAEGLSSSGQS
jgi:hypothetical protein